MPQARSRSSARRPGLTGNYINQGIYKLYSPSGDVNKDGRIPHGQAAGEMDPAVRQGRGPHLLRQPGQAVVGPFTSEATFQEGRLHGAWTIKDSHGQTIVQWSFDIGTLGHVELVASQRPQALGSDLRQRRPEWRGPGMGQKRQDGESEHLPRRQVRRQDGRMVHARPQALRTDLPPRLEHAGGHLRLVEQQHRHLGQPPPARTCNTACGPSGILAGTRRPRASTIAGWRWAGSPGGTRTARNRPKASSTPARRPHLDHLASQRAEGIAGGIQRRQARHQVLAMVAGRQADRIARRSEARHFARGPAAQHDPLLGPRH